MLNKVPTLSALLNLYQNRNVGFLEINEVRINVLIGVSYSSVYWHTLTLLFNMVKTSWLAWFMWHAA